MELQAVMPEGRAAHAELAMECHQQRAAAAAVQLHRCR